MSFWNGNSAKTSFGIDGEMVDEHLVQLPFLHANIKPPSKVIDVGCTGSPAALQLATIRYNVMGIDYNDYGIKHPNIKFVQGDFNAADLGKEKFDTAIVMNAIEHFGLQYYKRDEILDRQADIRAMTKIKEILSPGGQLIFSSKYGISDLATKSGKPFMRIYDEKALDVLLSAFKIDKTEYYLISDGKNIRQVPKEEAAGARYYGNSRSYAFVCISATKI
ncbi:MAG: class I SAM-dependent methyltransferase [Candidatus Micrarchaeota archaeon]|nr:class I SAM-dependent methyltransferase [Candidatus Micrarchaeota archaeon]